ncbi:hypothetical protein P3T26_004000 [Streptomyces sp. MAA16]|nr:hypothetical protein [Streptomyces sp. MAA16]
MRAFAWLWRPSRTGGALARSMSAGGRPMPADTTPSGSRMTSVRATPHGYEAVPDWQTASTPWPVRLAGPVLDSGLTSWRDRLAAWQPAPTVTSPGRLLPSGVPLAGRRLLVAGQPTADPEHAVRLPSLPEAGERDAAPPDRGAEPRAEAAPRRWPAEREQPPVTGDGTASYPAAAPWRSADGTPPRATAVQPVSEAGAPSASRAPSNQGMPHTGVPTSTGTSLSAFAGRGAPVPTPVRSALADVARRFGRVAAGRRTSRPQLDGPATVFSRRGLDGVPRTGPAPAEEPPVPSSASPSPSPNRLRLFGRTRLVPPPDTSPRAEASPSADASAPSHRGMGAPAGAGMARSGPHPFRPSDRRFSGAQPDAADAPRPPTTAARRPGTIRSADAHTSRAEDPYDSSVPHHELWRAEESPGLRAPSAGSGAGDGTASRTPPPPAPASPGSSDSRLPEPSVLPTSRPPVVPLPGRPEPPMSEPHLPPMSGPPIPPLPGSPGSPGSPEPLDPPISEPPGPPMSATSVSRIPEPSVSRVPRPAPSRPRQTEPSPGRTRYGLGAPLPYMPHTATPVVPDPVEHPTGQARSAPRSHPAAQGAEAPPAFSAAPGPSFGVRATEPPSPGRAAVPASSSGDRSSSTRPTPTRPTPSVAAPLPGLPVPGRRADSGVGDRPGPQATVGGRSETRQVAQEVARHHVDALAAVVLPELRRRERRTAAPSWSRDAIGIPGMPPR